CMHELGRKYPDRGYGGQFGMWLALGYTEPYNSWGNGSSMRVSPVAWSVDTLEGVEKLAKVSAEVTHNHPEGIKGAQAIAGATFLARTGATKEEIKSYVERTYGYDLDRTIAQMRPTYQFHVSCQESVPQAIIAFLEGESFEEIIRLAISLGGDSDTIAAMAGSIAQGCYPIPVEMVERCHELLTPDLQEILDMFDCVYVSERVAIVAVEATKGE
ncbi:MAG: ADP-ribosylglycohydrolase family protein, partial [Phocaeicola sp.]